MKDIIIQLIPHTPVILMGVIAFAVPFLTGWENRKLSRETNIYQRKKEVLEEFSKACGEYFGLLQSQPATMVFVDDDGKYKNEALRTITKCKWIILKNIAPEEYDKIEKGLSTIESQVYTLTEEYLFCKQNPIKIIEKRKDIDEIKTTIQKNIYTLNKILLQQHKKLSQFK